MIEFRVSEYYNGNYYRRNTGVCTLDKTDRRFSDLECGRANIVKIVRASY